MTRRSLHRPRRSYGTLLVAVCLLTVIAVGFTKTLRASDNLDFAINGQIYDIVWDSRLFDGTPGFPGAILWHHNPSGIPAASATFNQASFETSIEAIFLAEE